MLLLFPSKGESPKQGATHQGTKMDKIATQITTALKTSEANAFVIFESEMDDKVEVLALWEAESEADVRQNAIASAMRLADKHGCGMWTVTWDYRDDSK